MMLAQNPNTTTDSNFSRTHHLYPFYSQQPLQHLDLDGNVFEPITTDSIASSSHPAQSSLLTHYSNNYSTSTPLALDSSRRGNLKFPSQQQSFAGAVERRNHPQALDQVPELMHSESYLLHSQQQTPRAAHRLGHQRESSLSSLGSNGPASPYNANTSNPHIAITDSNSDGYHDLSGDCNYSYTLGKQPITMGDSFYASLQNLHSHGSGTADMTFPDGLSNLSGDHLKPKVDRGLLPAPELSSIGSSTRSHPVSVASSTAGGDSPATPSFHEPEDDARRRKNAFNHAVPPKLDRTLTDIYSDELYSPNFTITSASPPPQTHLAMSPSSELFAQRLQAANSQHLSAAQSPVSSSSRNQSPFRQGSPLAPTMNDFSQHNSQVRLSSAQQLREKRKLEQDAKALQQQMARAVPQQQGTPSTISPKDAMLEFNESDDSNYPLFPPQDNSGFMVGQTPKALPQQAQNFQQPTPMQSAFNFNMPAAIQVPQQYPFIARPRQQQATPSVSTFSRVGSAETNGSSDSGDMPTQRPARTNADGGTYTCTYHGCTLRFETPALLQKHKREGHRQANALSTARPAVAAAAVASPGIPDTLLGSQAGPHRCDRINPSTGKPCDTVFSRPYDLTRHEDTIHNARKQKVRCNLCTEEKTFSRADALTRHYRVCHPDVEFPGKHRRRGTAAA